MNRVITIDGSYGEGGGQIVRSAIALSAIMNQPIKITNIRAKRRTPGLARQHLTGIQSVKKITNAKVSALDVGSTTVEFAPGTIAGGSYTFDIGTAGSIPLVCQALIPVCLFANAPVDVTITGGTDVKFAPPIDYLRFVFLELLRRMGVRCEISLSRRGYYPKGGGKAGLHIEPVQQLKPLKCIHQGSLHVLRGRIHCSNLPGHISKRMQSSALQTLRTLIDTHHSRLAMSPEHAHAQRAVELDITIEDPRAPTGNSLSPGTGILVVAETSETILGADSLGERGVPAEKVAISAVRMLMQELDSKATVDIHAADMLLPYLAIGGGTIHAREMTEHMRTGCWLIEQFTGKAFDIQERLEVGGVAIRYKRE